MRFYCSLIIIGMLFTTAGCGLKKDKGNQAKQQPIVLANVNGSPITNIDLAYVEQRLMANMVVNEDMSAKLFESLVSSRAMATLAEQQLTPAQKQQLLADVSAYKEDLLVKLYINAHAKPEPVSQGLVKAYYLEHPKEFGADTIIQFEYIESYGQPDDSKRKALRKKLATVTPSQNLRKYAAQLQQQGHSIRYKQAELRQSLIQAPLDTMVKNTALGQFAPIYDQHSLILLKVISQQQTPPKPFGEVSAQIRKKLAPMQFKKAIKHLSESARKNSTIEYLVPKEAS